MTKRDLEDDARASQVRAIIDASAKTLAALARVAASIAPAEAVRQGVSAADAKARAAELVDGRPHDIAAAKSRREAIADAASDLAGRREAQRELESRLADLDGRLREAVALARSGAHDVVVCEARERLAAIRAAVEPHLAALPAVVPLPCEDFQSVVAVRFLVESLPEALAMKAPEPVSGPADAWRLLIADLNAERGRLDEAREQLAREKRRAAGLPF